MSDFKARKTILKAIAIERDSSVVSYMTGDRRQLETQISPEIIDIFVEHLVIIDLKTTGLALGGKEKGQVWKYVKELREKGYLRGATKVDGFVLGDKIEPGENEPTKQGEGVTITPMLYETILTRAEKRLLNLHTKVNAAPFLQEQKQEIEAFMAPVTVRQAELSQS